MLLYIFIWLEWGLIAFLFMVRGPRNRHLLDGTYSHELIAVALSRGRLKNFAEGARRQPFCWKSRCFSWIFMRSKSFSECFSCSFMYFQPFFRVHVESDGRKLPAWFQLFELNRGLASSGCGRRAKAVPLDSQACIYPHET